MSLTAKRSINRVSRCDGTAGIHDARFHWHAKCSPRHRLHQIDQLPGSVAVLDGGRTQKSNDERDEISQLETKQDREKETKE